MENRSILRKARTDHHLYYDTDWSYQARLTKAIKGFTDEERVALVELTAAEEARIGELVKKVVS